MYVFVCCCCCCWCCVLFVLRFLSVVFICFRTFVLCYLFIFISPLCFLLYLCVSVCGGILCRGRCVCYYCRSQSILLELVRWIVESLLLLCVSSGFVYEICVPSCFFLVSLSFILDFFFSSKKKRTTL